MAYELINTLTESRNFRSKQNLDQINAEDMAELFYLTMLVLYVLYLDESEKMWVRRYLSKTSVFGNYNYFRTSSTDLYLMVFVLLGNYENYKYQSRIQSNIRLTEMDFKRFTSAILSGAENESFFRRNFYKLEIDLRIRNNYFKRFRREILNWNELDDLKKRELLKKIEYFMKRIAPRAEVLDPLHKTIMNIKK